MKNSINFKTGVITGDLKKFINSHLLKAAKAKSDGVDMDVDDVVDTITIICSLTKGEKRVYTQEGMIYNIDEYEVCPQLERLCTPRGVYFDDSDFKVDLRMDSVDKGRFASAAIEIDSMEDQDAKEIAMMSLWTDLRTVPLTPAAFKAAQIRIINVVRGKIDKWTTISELSTPTLLSSVKYISDGQACNMPAGDWNSLPIVISIAHDVYESYYFAYPVSQFVDQFALELVASML